MIPKEEPVVAEAPVEPAAPVAAPVSPMAKIKGMLTEVMNMIAELEGPEAEVVGPELSEDLGSKMAGGMEMPMPKKGMKE